MLPFFRIFKSNHLPLAVLRTHGRTLATVPSSGPDLQLVGQCSAEMDEDSVPPRFPLAPTIRLANASVDELRQEFLHFFHSNQHTVVAPASVFPKRHEGSYFVNAGMNQFKPLFLGQTDSSTSTQFNLLRRATNCQPCIRIGGRHDDLNDVGYDRQHHTMFEMLGSWSFGDYYKVEACRYMWTFVTKVLRLPPNALYVTYFGGCPRLGLPPDDETRNIWLSLGVLDQKLMPFGIEHNFWRAGQSSGAGLCGPATELHVDFNALSGQEGLRCARCLINSLSPQVVELWNTVFITHRLRAAEGDTFSADLLEPLPKQFVDTGMGLERLACVMQGVTSTYDSDVFAPLLAFIQSKASTSSWTAPEYTGVFLPFCRQPVRDPEETSGQATTMQTLSKLLRELFIQKRASRPACPTRQCMESHPDCTSHLTSAESKDEHHMELLDRWHRDTGYRLLADHSRALAHSLSDGLLPGRQGLALKLRHLIHRATRAAILTGLDREDASVSLLASLVAEVARRNGSVSLSNCPVLQGPSARQPSSLSPEAMESVINQEVRSFLPRLHETEAAFERCLAENPEATRLSADQVRGLLQGKYGSPVSWDMVCAQSHWAGLCIPDPVPAAPPPSDGRRTPRTQPSTLSRQLHNASIPTTDDAPKYTYERNSDSPCSSPIYVVPVCRTRIVGLLLPPQDRSGDHILLTPEGDRTPYHISSNSSHNNLYGILCERTNFFSPEGGQDCDTGTIRIGSNTFKVENVEHISESTEHGPGWVVHWCHPVDPIELAPNDLLLAREAELTVDQQHRIQLMCHHTGQHLFVWALDTYGRQLFGSEKSTAMQHHGGSVHSDHFTVNAAILDRSGGQHDLIDLVTRVEELCLDAIRRDLPVTAVNVDWTHVDKNQRVRRFPWMNYPSQVTAVCVGATDVLENSTHAVSTREDDAIQGMTAELCCGTHLHRTGDVFDLVVTSVRARKQAVKEFTGIVGEAARAARLLGDALVAEALSRESSTNSSNTSEQIEWLTNILSQTSPTNPNAHILPLVAREKLEACLRRMKMTRVRPSVVTDDNLSTVVTAVRKLQSECQTSVPLASVEFDKPDTVVQALLQVEPSKPMVIYCGSQAVYYCPHASQDSNGAALNNAHAIARELVRQQPHSKWIVKARPLRSSSLSDLNRFKFAVWQITPSSTQETSSILEFWDQYSTCFQNIVASLAFKPTDRRNVSSGV